MRKVLKHRCHSCDWQQTLALGDGGRDTQERLDHCPQCRAPSRLIRRATRLAPLPAYANHLGATVAYQQHGKLPLKGVDSPYEWRQQKSLIFDTTRK